MKFKYVYCDFVLTYTIKFSIARFILCYLTQLLHQKMHIPSYFILLVLYSASSERRDYSSANTRVILMAGTKQQVLSEHSI